MNLFDVTLFGVGGVLVYSAVKGYSPVDVVKYGLGGPAPVTRYGKGVQDWTLDNGKLKVTPQGPNETPNKNGVPYDPDAGTGTLKSNGDNALYNGDPTGDTPSQATGV